VTEFLSALTEAASLTELAIACGTAALAGFIRGFIGFGGALIVILVLSLLFGPQAAVAIATLSGLPAMFQLLPAAIRSSERAFVLPFGLATFAAAPLGAWVLVSADPALMKMAIAAFVLFMVAALHQGWSLGRGNNLASVVVAGGAAGLIQGSAGIGGPPAVAAALSRPGPVERQRANLIGGITFLNLCALVPFWLHGLFTAQVLAVALVIVPLYSGAIWLGTRYFARGGQRHFRNAALLMLAVIGTATLAVAAQDYFAG